VRVEFLGAKQVQRIGARRFSRIHPELVPHRFGVDVIPHRLRVAEKTLTIGHEPAEVHAAQRLERSVVRWRDLHRLDDLLLALEPLAPKRRELRLYDARPRPLDQHSLVAVGGVTNVDRRPLVRDDATVIEVNDRASFPRDLALVERRERVAGHRIREPLEEETCGAMRVGSFRGRTKLLAHQRERILTEYRRVTRVDGLKVGGGLETGVRKIVFARDLLHELLALAPQPVERQRLHVARRSRNTSATRAASMRSCCSVSRSRIVTV
jgi:hypothetical protein